ncbi:hypothetical protein EFK50_09575 [Nocardioides marmoriginsengisoli]|uniref:Uncharacterized protein n=1 Tax=Nocardioides marmoriginsengisoli TaxID=661483 RepID=A0A3N0CGD3_9ACTN|nr:hypothetical protein EFK50_09575 [Nocardioides marmoriginsengisoli]
MRTKGLRVLGALVTVGALLLAAGCGSGDPDATPSAGSSSDAPEGADLVGGDWLLRFTVESGGEGELTAAVYVAYNPSTGTATARRLPTALNPDTYSDGVAVLVSGDQKVALQDTGVPRSQGRQGRLTVYSTTTDAKRVVDVRALTGRPDLIAVGAAFDPKEPEVLRVVDTERAVWRLDLVAGTGARDGSLPRHRGWIFANGFDKNTGLPYIEDTDSEATLPAGNGIGDVRPVQRRGGEIRVDDGTEKPGEPATPCGFSGGFVAEDGTTWLFCADTARISAYRLLKGGTTWEPVGKASPPIVPGSAVELPVVLPPV